MKEKPRKNYDAVTLHLSKHRRWFRLRSHISTRAFFPLVVSFRSVSFSNSSKWELGSRLASRIGAWIQTPLHPPRLSLNTADHWVSRLDPPFRCRLLLYNRSKHTVYRRFVLYPLHTLAEITTVTTGSLAPQWVSSCCSRNFHRLRVSSLPLVMCSSSYWLVIPSGGN